MEGDVNWGDAVEGGTIIGVGAGITGFGLGLAAIGIGELTVGSPTIVGVFAGFHELIMGVGITGAEVVIMEKGVEKLAKSGILPAFNPINPR